MCLLFITTYRDIDVDLCVCVCAVGLLISPPQCICICIAFRPYIEEVLIMLLKGMSDDVSSCRDTAFKAPVTASQQLKSI